MRRPKGLSFTTTIYLNLDRLPDKELVFTGERLQRSSPNLVGCTSTQSTTRRVLPNGSHTCSYASRASYEIDSVRPSPPCSDGQAAQSCLIDEINIDVCTCTDCCLTSRFSFRRSVCNVFGTTTVPRCTPQLSSTCALVTSGPWAFAIATIFGS